MSQLCRESLKEASTDEASHGGMLLPEPGSQISMARPDKPDALNSN